MRASESERAIICPHSLIAPKSLVRRQKSDAKANTGTLLHYWKETGEVAPEIEKKIIMSRADRDVWWPPDRGEHEVTFAINLYTFELREFEGVKTLGDEWKKKFDPKIWLTGSIDWVGKRLVGWRDAAKTQPIFEPWVDDLKTGDWAVSPEENKQFASYAAYCWVRDGMPLEYRVHTSATNWPWYPLNGRPERWWKEEPLTALDIREHLADIKWAVEHPNEVNTVDDVVDPKRFTKAGTPWVLEMSPCTFCDARVPFPATEWMQHYKYRALPMCVSGMVQRISRAEEEET